MINQSRRNFKIDWVTENPNFIGSGFFAPLNPVRNLESNPHKIEQSATKNPAQMSWAFLFF